MITINGRKATAAELEALLKLMEPTCFKDIVRAMLDAAPEQTLHAMQTAIDTLKSERKPSDPNTNH